MEELRRLSETETEVMNTIWDKAGPVTVGELLQDFERSKGWKTSTLSTILTRLIQKGFLTKTMQGKVNNYSPTLSREEYKNNATKSFMQAVHGGSVTSFIAALTGDMAFRASNNSPGDAALSREELANLRKWLDAWEDVGSGERGNGV